MTLGRREFLTGAGALAVSARSAFAFRSTARGVSGAAQTRGGGILPASVRADFPSVALETHLNSASMHPVGTFAARGMEQVLNFRLHGPGPGRADSTRKNSRT
jgi:hypothetical protein